MVLPVSCLILFALAALIMIFHGDVAQQVSKHTEDISAWDCEKRNRAIESMKDLSIGFNSKGSFAVFALMAFFSITILIFASVRSAGELGYRAAYLMDSEDCGVKHFSRIRYIP